MKKQNLNKFVRKNIVLQDKLEKFLQWRKKSSTPKISNLKLNEIQKLKDQKVFTLGSNPKRLTPELSFKEFLKSSSLKTKFIKYHSSEDVYKIYKPISMNLFQSLTRVSLWNPKFFPDKKPFMQFWIFPLLGACFFNSLNVDPHKKMMNKNSNFFKNGLIEREILKFSNKIISIILKLELSEIGSDLISQV